MKTLNILLALATVIFVWTFGFIYIGSAPTIIIGGSMTLGFIGWLIFGQKPADPKIVLPPFLIMLMALFIHLMEEYYKHFPQDMSRLFHVHFTEATFLLVFEQVAPIIYLFVILGLFLRNAYANFFAWFLIIGMGIGEITHYIFPMIQGGGYRYFPGEYTAWLPIVTGFWALYRFYKASKAH